MSISLQFGGADDYVNLDTPLYLQDGESIEFNIIQDHSSGYEMWVSTWDSNPTFSDGEWYFGKLNTSDGRLTLYNRFSTQRNNSDAGVLVVGEDATFTLERTGDTLRVLKNGTQVIAPLSFNSGHLDLYPIKKLMKENESGTSYCFTGKLISATFGVRHNWSPADSDTSNTGLQPVLTDTIGSNDATGVNFPTDGSAWISDGPTPVDIEIVVNSAKQIARVSTVAVTVASILNTVAAKQGEKVSANSFELGHVVNVFSAKQIEKSSTSILTLNAVLDTVAAKQLEKVSTNSVELGYLVNVNAAKQIERATPADITANISIAVNAAKQLETATTVDISNAVVTNLAINSAKQIEKASTNAVSIASIINTVSARQIETVQLNEINSDYVLSTAAAKQTEKSSLVEVNFDYLIATASAKQVERASFVSIFDGGRLSTSLLDDSNVVALRTSSDFKIVLTTPEKVVIQTTPIFYPMET